MALGSFVSQKTFEKWNFYIVHSKLEKRALETVDVFVGQINAKQTPLVIKFIRECLPFDTLDLSYLKKLQKIDQNNENITLEIILHSTKDLSFEELKKKLNEHSIDIHVRIIQVSKYAPLTYEQFREWSTLWPLHFRKNTLKQIEFTDTTLLKLKTLMKNVWSLVNECNKIKIATMIVDSNLNTIVACVDSRLSSKNPLKHSIINCITEIGRQAKTKGTSNIYIYPKLIYN